MALESELANIGDKVEIYVKGLEKPIKYKSQILDILNNTEYIISGPIHKNVLIPIHKGEIIEIKYFKEGIGRFVFNAVVNDRILEKIYKLEIKRISEIKRLQERNFYRLPISLKVMKKHNLSDNDLIQEIEEECITLDLSGGGLKLLCNYRHEIGEEVTCIFLHDLNITVYGKIIRVEEVVHPQYKYSLGIEFINVNEETRDYIIKYIFNEQRKLRRKGLI